MTRNNRRSALAALALVVAGAAIATSRPAEAGNRDFTLINELPWAVTTLYLRPSGTESWSQDLFGQAVLHSGQQAKLRLGEGGQCLFDVRFGVADSSAAALSDVQRVNLCTLDSMAIHWDRGFKVRMRSYR